VDLADVLSERGLADAVHESEVRRLFDLAELNEAMARVPGRRGRHKLGRVLVAWEPRPLTRSEAERRFGALCEEHGIRKPQANATRGGYELDFLWPEAGLAAELDGRAAHHTSRAFHGDRRRDRELAVLGIQVIRVTWRDLEDDSAALARQLRALAGSDPTRR
jgi:very-short-patch-repair endonuclease